MLYMLSMVLQVFRGRDPGIPRCHDVGVDVHMMYTGCTHPYYMLYMLTYVYILHVRSSVYILYVMLMYTVVVVCCTWCAHGVHMDSEDEMLESIHVMMLE
jgi:hypothetical protein